MNKVKKIIPLIFLSLIIGRVNAQKKLKFDKNYINKIQYKRKQSLKKKKYSKAIIYTDTLISYYNKCNVKNSLKKEFNRKAYYFYMSNKRDSAYFYYRKTIKHYKIIKDSSKIVDLLKEISDLESYNELYYKSDSTAIRALEYSKNKEVDLSTIISLYNRLGINARNQGEYNEAEDWYQKAITRTKDSLRKVRYVNNLAIYYKYIKDYSMSIKLYKGILKNTYYDSIDDKLKGKIIDNYAYIRFLNGEKIQVDDFLLAQSLKKRINNKKGLITNYDYLSDFYADKDKKTALKYLKKMYQLAKVINVPEDRLKALGKLSYYNINDYKKYRKEEDFLRDSINSVKRKSRNKLVKIIYNIDTLKEQKLLAEIESEQQKSKKQLWFFLGLTSFLGFITYFFYKRAKTKREKIIEVYKTETRLAKKIHDELANDMYLAMNKLQKEEREDVSILYDLEKIYSLTRNISHENSPVITGELFEGFLKQLFVDFTGDTCKVMSKGLPEIHLNTLRKEKQIVLYRIVQELLVNMKKHSKANLVVISFSVIKDTIQVLYKDNGIGIATLEIKNGLQNMETRIKSIGGTVIFESEMQKGFQAKFQFKK